MRGKHTMAPKKMKRIWAMAQRRQAQLEEMRKQRHKSFNAKQALRDEHDKSRKVDQQLRIAQAITR